MVSILLLLFLSWAVGIGEFSNDMGNAETCACNIPRSTVFGNDVGNSAPKPPSPSPSDAPLSSSQRIGLASDEVLQESARADRDMVVIPGRVFEMGTDSPGMPYDGESPRRRISVSTFLIDKYEVSNSQYEEFVRDTGHVTDSERWNWSFVLYSSLSKAQQKRVTQWVQGAPWWTQIEGSYWRAPEGPGSDVFHQIRRMEIGRGTRQYTSRGQMLRRFVNGAGVVDCLQKPNGNLRREDQPNARFPLGKCSRSQWHPQIEHLRRRFPQEQFYGRRLCLYRSCGRVWSTKRLWCV